MIIQAVWAENRFFLYVFDEKLAETFEEHDVTEISHVYEMDPDVRKQVMSELSKVQVAEIEEALQSYPVIDWNVE